MSAVVSATLTSTRPRTVRITNKPVFVESPHFCLSLFAEWGGANYPRKWLLSKSRFSTKNFLCSPLFRGVLCLRRIFVVLVILDQHFDLCLQLFLAMRLLAASLLLGKRSCCCWLVRGRLFGAILLKNEFCQWVCHFDVCASHSYLFSFPLLRSVSSNSARR